MAGGGGSGGRPIAGAPWCDECPLRRMPLFRPFNAEQLAFMQGLKVDHRLIPAGEHVFVAGGPRPAFYTLFSGWAFTYRPLRGGGRQIIHIAIAGDILGFQHPLLPEVSLSACALTDASVCVFPTARMVELTSVPGLGHDVAWLIAAEKRRIEEHLAQNSRRSALDRTAYLLCEIHHRVTHLRGGHSDQPCEFPLTQQHLADALGLTVVHVNRTLRELREAGLADTRRRRLWIDPARLKALADYPDDERGAGAIPLL
jgi:CRP/FNR family transcriptional regulator, anaerobic regulatory protein